MIVHGLAAADARRRSDEEAIRVGEEALAMADAARPRRDRRRRRSSTSARREARSGTIRGLDEIARGVDVARAANAAFEHLPGHGQPRRPALGERAAGARRPALWIEAERGGRAVRPDGLRALVPRCSRHRRSTSSATGTRRSRGRTRSSRRSRRARRTTWPAQVYVSRALIRLGRGDADGAVADAELASSSRAAAKDPQALYPSCAAAAHVFMELGERSALCAPAEEFLAGIGEGTPARLRGRLPRTCSPGR